MGTQIVDRVEGDQGALLTDVFWIMNFSNFSRLYGENDKKALHAHEEGGGWTKYVS